MSDIFWNHIESFSEGNCLKLPVLESCFSQHEAELPYAGGKTQLSRFWLAEELRVIVANQWTCCVFFAREDHTTIIKYIYIYILYIYIYVDIRKERSNNRIVCTWRKVMNTGHFQPCSVGATQTFQPPTLLTMFAPSPVCPTQRAVTFSLSSKGFVQWTTSGVWNDPCSFQHREPVDFRFQLRRMCTCCMRYV